MKYQTVLILAIIIVSISIVVTFYTGVTFYYKSKQARTEFEFQFKELEDGIKSLHDQLDVNRKDLKDLIKKVEILNKDKLNRFTS